MISTLGVVLSTLALSPSADWEKPLTVARCPFEAPALPQDADTALDATLILKTSDGAGSAVVISPDGFVLTAAHVIGDQDRVDVIAHGGAELVATTVRVDAEQDVALLKIEAEQDVSCLPLLEGKAKLGSDVFILGSPAGEALSFSISKGIVSGYRSFEGLDFVQLDASVNPGNSGGPAVDADGNVVGIASWKLSHVALEGLAFAVPTDVALRELGVTLGPESSSDWKALRGRVPAAAAPASSTDLPPPRVDAAASDEDEPFDADRIRRRRIRRGFMISGGVIMGVGLPMLIGSAVSNATADEMTSSRWNTLKGVNTAGWTMTFAGAALLVTGIAIPKASKKGPSEVSVAPVPGGVTVQGRF